MIILLAFAAATMPTCRLKNARYSLRTAPAVTAYFSKTRSHAKKPYDIAFATHFAGSGRTFWWIPVPPATNDLQHLESTTDIAAPNWHPWESGKQEQGALGELEYVFTDNNYTILDGVPEIEGLAPSHILLPRLGDAMWSDLFVSDGTREAAPKQFFDLTSCRADKGD